MVYSRTGYTIATNGQSLVIAAPTVGGATATVYTTAACTAAHTFPQTITSDTTYYVDPTGTLGRYLVSAKQPDGTELWGKKVDCFAGDGIKTISPLPSLAQVAADVSDSYFEQNVMSGYREVIPRALLNTSTQLATGRLKWTSFVAQATESIASVACCVGATAAGATPSLVRFAIFTVAADSSMELVASTANDTSLLAATETISSKALSSPYTITAGTRYAVGVCCVTAATAPVLVAATGGSIGVNNQLPKLAGTLTGLSDLPSTVAAASVNPGATASLPWFGLVPA